MHDPLAVGVIIDPTLVSLQNVTIKVATSADPVPAQTLMRVPQGDEGATIRFGNACGD